MQEEVLLLQLSELKVRRLLPLHGYVGVFSVCGCYLPGSVSENCDLTTGQCLCRDGAEGQNCDTCILSQKPFVNISECLGTIVTTGFSFDCNQKISF